MWTTLSTVNAEGMKFSAHPALSLYSSHCFSQSCKHATATEASVGPEGCEDFATSVMRPPASSSYMVKSNHLKRIDTIYCRLNLSAISLRETATSEAKYQALHLGAGCSYNYTQTPYKMWRVSHNHASDCRMWGESSFINCDGG